MSFIFKFIKKYTTGAPFIVFFTAGFVVSIFFSVLYFLKSVEHIDVAIVHYIDFQKIFYVLLLSAVWFVLSDIAKKKEIFPQSIHFFTDSIFYLTTFGLIVYYTEGLHAGFYPLLFLAAIASAIFGNTRQTFVFLILLSIETYALYFLTQKENERDIYHIILLAFYVFFYFLLAWIVQYFYKKIRENEKKYVDLFEAAKSAEEKYSDLIETTPLCIKVFDKNMKMVFLNKGGRKEHFIKDTDDISKWDWVGTVKKEYQAEAKEKFQNAFSKGESNTLEFEHIPEGSTHEWCSSLISPIKDKDGKVKSVLFLSTDITSLKKAELKAKQNEQMFKILLDATPLCIKWFDKNGKLISINKGGREEHHLENLSEEEIKNWNYMGCIDEANRAEVKNKMDLALKGITSTFEIKHVPGTSKGEWCLSTLTPVKNKSEVEYVLFLSRDITDEKLIEEERSKNLKKSEEAKVALFNILEDVKDSEKNLKEERDRSTAIIQSMGEGLLVLDEQLKIVLMNLVAEKILDMSFKEVIGINWRDLVAVYKEEKEIPREKCVVLEVIDKNKAASFGLEDNIYYKNYSGRKFPVTMIITPLRVNEKNHAVIIFNDASKEKALDEARTSFISIASHQLRTPLTSIRWYAEMLSSEDVGKLNEQQKDFVNRVYGGALRLNEIINLMLTLSRIESGKIEVEKTKIDLIEFTQDLIKDLEALISNKEIKVKFAPKDKNLPKIDFDTSILRQITTNLLSNSIRYTDLKGNIEINIEKTKDEIVFSVKDDGIGIPKQYQEKIFTKFFRAENAVSKIPDGSGLGLSLVKALVEMNKGRVWFESPATWTGENGKETKKGTTFYFTIPIKLSNTNL